MTGWHVLSLASTALGIGGLRYVWRRGSSKRAVRVSAWMALVAAVFLFAAAGGFDAGTMIGLSTISVVAYGVIAGGLEIRKARAKRAVPAADTLDPPPSSRNPARIALRVLAVTVLAAAAALALAATLALHGFGAPIDRMISAAFLLPLLWGAAMVWALADAKPLRPVVGFAVIIAAGAAIAWLAPVSI